MRRFPSFWRRGLAVGACALLGLRALAQTLDRLPPMQGEGTAHGRCGGIGLDESTALRAAMPDHPLSLLFARPNGEYLADVDVAIQDAKGAPVLALRARGPVCLIDLPAGRYTVEARSEGVSKRQVVTLGRGSRTLDFRF